MNAPQPSPTTAAAGGFGANEWLVEEMYQQYLADPGSVDQAWHDFFDDYKPSENGAAAPAEQPARQPAA
ncbi:hypothetical protein, partial [Klenkia sp. PcliD-1-E]|uniref:2-oxoglutarate dehydrogenase E1 subunit family protein n=1 Tax=Klenkia sp. PcliD-1-E TaxID=2954492 RepID=UPI002098047E